MTTPGISPGQQLGKLGCSRTMVECATIMGLKPGSQSVPLTLTWLVVELCVTEGKLKFWQNFILRQSNYRAPTLGVKTFSVKR